MPGIQIGEACIEIIADDPESLVSSFESDFARRYIPSFNVSRSCSEKDAVVYWLRDRDFRVVSTSFSMHGYDIYVVQGEPPEPYSNESPVFFLLQVLARSLARRGYVVLTDSVVLRAQDKSILILGYPHTGKSTIATIAYSQGYTVYSTENTVIKPLDNGLQYVSGTRVLVFDPVIVDKYGLKLKVEKRTRHGYGVIDLDKEGYMASADHPLIDEIYIVYTNFSSSGCSTTPVKGRKIAKLIWQFATSLIKGMDYYAPAPIDIPLDESATRTINRLINVVTEIYNNRFFEVFGSPLEVFKWITGFT